MSQNDRIKRTPANGESNDREGFDPAVADTFALVFEYARAVRRTNRLRSQNRRSTRSAEQAQNVLAAHIVQRHLDGDTLIDTYLASYKLSRPRIVGTPEQVKGALP